MVSDRVTLRAKPEAVMSALRVCKAATRPALSTMTNWGFTPSAAASRLATSIS